MVSTSSLRAIAIVFTVATTASCASATSETGPRDTWAITIHDDRTFDGIIEVVGTGEHFTPLFGVEDPQELRAEVEEAAAFWAEDYQHTKIDMVEEGDLYGFRVTFTGESVDGLWAEAFEEYDVHSKRVVFVDDFSFWIEDYHPDMTVTTSVTFPFPVTDNPAGIVDGNSITMDYQELAANGVTTVRVEAHG